MNAIHAGHAGSHLRPSDPFSGSMLRGSGRALGVAAALLVAAGGARGDTLASGSVSYLTGLTCSAVVPSGASILCGGQRAPNDAGLPLAPMLTTLDPTSGAATSRVLQPAGKISAAGKLTSVSRDASCAAGYLDNGIFTPYHALRWTEGTGPVDLGTLEPAANADRSSFAAAVGQDCSVVVGTSDADGGTTQRAFRWSTGGGMVSLGLPPGARAGASSRAFGVSADGAIVVGDSEFADNDSFSGFRNGAFRWAGGTFQSLGALEPGFFSVATAVSANGAVVVGQGGVSVKLGNVTANGSRAFRWTAGEGLRPIGPLPGDQFAAATGVSDDGRVVVGMSSSGPLARGLPGFNPGTGAFRWTEATGIRDLRQLLVDAGIDMTGIALVEVTAISPDGQWIAGAATTPQTGPGESAAFVVRYCDGATGSCASPPSLNVQGLWWNAPAGSESGWGVNFAHQGDVVFATWFTYDASGEPWWLIAVLNRNAEGAYTGQVSTVTGPPFDSVPFDSGTIVETAVGTMSVAFDAGGAGTLSYTVNGISQTKPITRQVFGPVPACVWGAQHNLAQAANYQDLWWNPGESGWGVNLTHQGDTIVATWFTYDAAGKPWWLIAVLLKAGAGTYSGDVSTVRGPPFDAVPFDPGLVVETIVGTATVTFADGNDATFSYDVNGVAQAKSITRQVFAPPGTVCDGG